MHLTDVVVLVAVDELHLDVVRAGEGKLKPSKYLSPFVMKWFRMN